MEIDHKQNIMSWAPFETKVVELFEMVHKLPVDLQVKAAQFLEEALAKCIQTLAQSAGEAHELYSQTEPLSIDLQVTACQKDKTMDKCKRNNSSQQETEMGSLLGIVDYSDGESAQDLQPLSDGNTDSSKDEENHLKQKPKAPRGRPKLGKKHVCSKCSKVFRRPCELREHVSFVHEGKKRGGLANTQCEDCGRLFQTPGGLNFHRKRYHEIGREVHRCQECTYATFKKECMESHMRKFHGPNRKQNCMCDVCGKGFSKESQLKMHREVHSEEKKYSCKQCSFTTHTMSGLRSHVYTQHNPNARMYQCETCNKRWKKRHLYKYHMEKHHRIQIHMTKKPGPRPVCGDAVVMEKAAIAIAAESMATLSSMPALEDAVEQAAPFENLHNQIATEAPSSLQSTSATGNIPQGLSVTATHNPSTSREGFSNVPIPVLCFNNSLDPSNPASSQKLVQATNLMPTEDCRDEELVVSHESSLGKLDTVYQVPLIHNANVPTQISSVGTHSLLNPTLTFSQSTNMPQHMVSVIDNLLNQMNAN